MSTKRVPSILLIIVAVALTLLASPWPAARAGMLAPEGGPCPPPLPIRSSGCPARAANHPAQDISPPTSPLKLVFIHHSCGDAWLSTGDGNLGNELGANNYYVSDTYYDWGPDDIGSYTDIGDWWDWFRGEHSTTYTQAVYNTTNRHADYMRPMADPGGENQIIMFKSCYPNSHLGGGPNDPPTTGDNPLREEDHTSMHHTVGNAKGIYNDILDYFRSRQDKLFIVITAPPLEAGDTDAVHAANARAFNTWLVEDWLAGYPHNNVAVFDFYNVLTSNGGDWQTNDAGWDTGNHHRYRSGAIQYITDQGGNTAAYPDGGSDSHPAPAGNQKATAEFIPLLNIFYHRWTGGQPSPTDDHWIYLPLILRQVGSTPPPPPDAALGCRTGVWTRVV